MGDGNSCKSCYHRLTDQQKKIRAFVVSCEDSESQRPSDTKGTWGKLLVPERHWLKNADSQLEPICRRRKVSYDFFDPQMFIGCDWYWDGHGEVREALGRHVVSIWRVCL